MSASEPPPASTANDVRTDLVAEQDALDAIVSPLSNDQWATATPSPRWTVADQIGHLTYFDHTASMAITAPDHFREHVAALAPALVAGDPDAIDDLTLSEYRSMSPSGLLEAWRTNRQQLAETSARLHDDDRVIWYGPSMGSRSFLTARLMEAWAHGQDIVDALGIERRGSDRLRHIAQLGVITRKWSYVNRQLDAPAVPVRVELAAPSGSAWSYGPNDADESITGPALDFCLVVTQRRHVDDTTLTVTGAAARDWMLRAQAFAGAPTDGPAPTAS